MALLFIISPSPEENLVDTGEPLGTWSVSSILEAKSAAPQIVLFLDLLYPSLLKTPSQPFKTSPGKESHMPMALAIML